MKNTYTDKDSDWKEEKDVDLNKGFKKSHIILLSVISIIVLLVIGFFIFNENDDSTDVLPSENNTSQPNPPLSDQGSDLNNNVNESFFEERYDPQTLPVDKPDYSRHESSLIDEGVAEYLLRCYNRSFVDEETGESYLVEIDDENNQQLCQNGAENDEDLTNLQDLQNPASIMGHLHQQADDEVYFLANQFALRSNGYTNNPSEAFNADGSRNWNYSFVLSEDITFFFTHHIEKLINPHYGQWSEYQHSEANASQYFPTYLFKDLFTERWWNENIGSPGGTQNYSALPVFADWDADDYQRILEESGNSNTVLTEDEIRWVGEIEDYEFEYAETYDGRSFEIKAELDIKYHSNIKDSDDTVVVPAKLTVLIVPNYENPDLFTYRLIIDDAQFELL